MRRNSRCILNTRVLEPLRQSDTHFYCHIGARRGPPSESSCFDAVRPTPKGIECADGGLFRRKLSVRDDVDGFGKAAGTSGALGGKDAEATVVRHRDRPALVRARQNILKTKQR